MMNMAFEQPLSISQGKGPVVLDQGGGIFQVRHLGESAEVAKEPED